LVWAEQVPVAGTQAPATWQTSVATGQVTGVPPTQAPAWQVSTVVQPFPSLQATPSAAGVWAEHRPVAGAQVPATLQVEAVQTTGAPPEQVPRPLQMSFCVQALPSLQEVPLGAFGVLQVPVAVLQVPTEWQASAAVQTTGLAPTHWPEPLQWSDWVQALPSSQTVVVGALLAQGSFALTRFQTCVATRLLAESVTVTVMTTGLEGEPRSAGAVYVTWLEGVAVAGSVLSIWLIGAALPGLPVHAKVRPSWLTWLATT